VRRFRCEVRDHMNYRKNDRWPSYRFYSALHRQKSPMLHLRDFRSPAIFEFFNTIGVQRTSSLDSLPSSRGGSLVASPKISRT
jgi:hypothetical protein